MTNKKKNANKMQFRIGKKHKIKYDNMKIPIRSIVEVGIDNWYNNREDMLLLARYYQLQNKIQDNEDKIKELQTLNEMYMKEFTELKMTLSEISNPVIDIEMDKTEIAINIIQRIFDDKRDLNVSDTFTDKEIFTDFYKKYSEVIDITLKNAGKNTRDKNAVIEFLIENINI